MEHAVQRRQLGYCSQQPPPPQGPRGPEDSHVGEKHDAIPPPPPLVLGLNHLLIHLIGDRMYIPHNHGRKDRLMLPLFSSHHSMSSCLLLLSSQGTTVPAPVSTSHRLYNQWT